MENRRLNKHIVAVRDNPKQRTCIFCGGVSSAGILSIHRAEADEVVGSMTDISVRVVEFCSADECVLCLSKPM